MPTVKDKMTGEVISQQPYTPKGTQKAKQIAEADDNWAINYAPNRTTDGAMRQEKLYAGGGKTGYDAIGREKFHQGGMTGKGHWSSLHQGSKQKEKDKKVAESKKAQAARAKEKATERKANRAKRREARKKAFKEGKSRRQVRRVKRRISRREKRAAQKEKNIAASKAALEAKKAKRKETAKKPGHWSSGHKG